MRSVMEGKNQSRSLQKGNNRRVDRKIYFSVPSHIPASCHTSSSTRSLIMQPATSCPSATSPDLADGSKEQSGTFKTAFIHLHSLASRDISLPCPQELLGIVQQLLIEVVVFYEQFSVSRETPFTPEESDRLALYGQEFHLRLQFITNRIGERLMEAMLWAWLHSLLQGEKQWRQDLAYDQSLEHSSLLLCDFAASTGLVGRIKCRVKDASALRRVVVFTFEALRRISTLAPPVYTAQQEESSGQPPSYSAYFADGEGRQPAILFPEGTQEDHLQTAFTDAQLRNRVPRTRAQSDSADWRPRSPTLRHHSSSLSMRFNSRDQGAIKESTRHLDLQTDFTEWLQSPPLHNLRIDHRLERRHWSLEQLSSPILTTTE